MSDDQVNDALRRAVQGAVADLHSSPVLMDRVRTGAARRRKQTVATRTAGALAVAAVAVVAVGAAFSGHDRSQETAPANRTPLTCPAEPDWSHSARPRSGSDRHLVPGAPVEALVCDYDVEENQSPDLQRETVSLLRQESMTGSRLRQVVSASNSTLNVGEPSCPMFLRQNVLVMVFRYPTGPDVTVTIGVNGCPVVTNGTRRGTYDKGLPPQLNGLAPSPR